MKYRQIGQTDLKLSVIGVGTWQFGGEWGIDFTQSQVDEILNQAREEGINLLDTAECYGDHLSERFIGDYLKRHNRDDWVIATKFGHKFHNPFERTRHVNADDVLKQLDSSLKSLQTDRIDLYQSHSLTDEEFNNDDLWTMLDKQKQAGKIGHIGLSLQNEPSIHQTKHAKSIGADALQVVYNRLTRTPEEEIFPIAREHDLGVLARVPLASGYLSGKYKAGTTFDKSDVRSRHDQEDVNRKLEQVEKIKQEEVPEGVDLSSWALAWTLKHDAVTTVIPGCKSKEQVAKNAAAARLDLASTKHPQHVDFL
ncbi:Predicted oxidoreductase [Pelagirhabdus alkalitolerans]|uniref:Predicted oxidoreductase n=1 Tax=Pelagirhabdus alkalitolerans TaxID=1612202 RepID=A0A1G6L2M4_9BACI|nr:aldo/keto reductase [Pelagirhabdus alkalitolerans]SDC37447.1 Predicted oxidoreductase [Pelagirhabdus alkalitolerans]